ncbi:MAG: Ppx/GppA family phosphatase [Eggerthellaceae bacterium]|nr:Ppx/GppA family phosphatase [Eggerthellaceae bacterium]
MRLAAIDIGTVTSRLLVADATLANMTVLAKDYEVTNLGEGIDASGRLTKAAIKRVADAVDRFISLRDSFATPDEPQIPTMCVSTSAARDAENSGEFADMLAARGVRVEVISGDAEASLTFAGASSACASGADVAVIDVGGGSTEVSFGQAGEGIQAARSFDIGCRRMTERFLLTDPPTATELQQASAWARGQFEGWAEGQELARTPRELIAVAGTATSAISMWKKMAEYDANQVHGASMSLDALEGLRDELAGMTEQEREHVVGLDPRRAPVIVAGLVILSEAMRAFDMHRFTASESDILQGMISFMLKNHVRAS